MPRRGQPIAATARAFAFPLSWSVTVCAGVAILALCAAIYGTIGYVDEKRIAVAERVAVEHAIRTNADLQRQLDRARDALPASGAWGAAGMSPVHSYATVPFGCLYQPGSL